MKLNLAVTARFLFVSAAWATLPFAAPLHGASPGFPFAEDFQSQSLLDGTDNQNAVRWTNGGVTLGRAKNRHSVALGSSPRNVKIGDSVLTIGIKDIAAQDVDGDGNLDVVIANDNGIFAHFVDGTGDTELGSIQPVRITAVAVPVKAMAFGDFDRDGRLDVAAAGDVNAVVFHRNTGDRRAFITRSQVSNLRTIALAAVDLDGDGDLDLVLLQKKGSAVEVHLNDGVGNFSLRENAVPTTSGQNKALGIGDFNEDGRMDLVLAKTEGANVLYLNNRNGGFRDARLLSRPDSNVDYRDIAVGDVNSDGHLDILVGVHKAQNILYLGDGNGNFDTGSRINNSDAWTIGVELADLDGDGDLDIAEGAAKKGSRVYVNQGAGTFDSGSVISGKTNAVAVGDVDRDGHPGMIRGRTPKELRVAKLTPRQAGNPSTTRFNTGHGRVVSGKVNGVEGVPHVVFLTATEVQHEHTDIEYYLSNDGGKRWIRAYPGKVARFSSAGNVLRWRAELKSRSPVQTPTLTRVSIESVLQVFIDGEVFSNGQTHTAPIHTIEPGVEPTTATIRLVNRGRQAITITGITPDGGVFDVPGEPGERLPPPIEPNDEFQSRLIFNPMERGIHASTLTISGSEGGRVLPDIKVALRGQGIGAEIKVPEFINRRIEIPVGISDSRTVRITNEGEKPLTITSATATDLAFSRIEPATLPTTLTVGGPAKIFKFRFKPEAPGTVTTTITFISNAVNDIVTRTLTGKGLAPIIEIPPPALVSVREGRRTTGEVVIRNTGDWDMDITAVTGTDEFFDLVSPTTASINGIGLIVPKESSETVVFSFTPARGKRSSPTANIVFTSNAFNNTQTEVMLRGIGTAPEIATASASAVQFGNVRVESSTEREVVITNTGDAPLMVTSAMVTNLDGVIEPVFSLIEPGEFPQTVSTGATLSLKLRFKPGTVGNIGGILNIASDAVNKGFKPPTVSGKGVAPEITVLINDIAASKPEVMSYHFGDVDVNGRTEARVDIDNGGGGAPLEVQSPKDSSPDIDTNRHFRMTENVLFPITVGAEGVSRSSLTLFFEPKTHGTQTTTLTFVSDSLDSTETDITLTGVGLGAEMELRVGGERLAHNTTYTIGATRVKATTTIHVEVHNLGNVSMTVSSLVQPDRGNIEGFTLVESDNVLKAVTGGQSVTFGFQFSPGKPGTAINSITFNSDAVSRGKQTIILQGRALGPVISTVPDERTGVQFGDVRVGTSTDRKVVITNTGDLPLVVTSAMVTNRRGADEAALSLLGTEQLPQELNTDDALTLTLRFTPEARGRMTGTLVIISNSAGSGEQTIRLQGRAVAPVISLMPDTLLGVQFGDVRTGTSSDQKVMITNTGDAPLTVTSAEVTVTNAVGVSTSAFSLVNPPEFPKEVSAGGTLSLTLRFTPEENKGVGGYLDIESDALISSKPLPVFGQSVAAEISIVIAAPGASVSHNSGINRFMLEALSYDFGSLRAGESASAEVFISNRYGRAPLRVGLGLEDNPHFGWENSPAGGVVVVEAGESTSGLILTFNPESPGVKTVEFAMESDAYNVTRTNVTLTGEGPDVVVVVRVGGKRHKPSGDIHDFGNVLIGESTSRDVVIHNNSNTPMEIYSVSAGPPASSFTVSSDHRAEVVAIGRGSSEQWTLSYNPPADGTTAHTGTLAIESNIPGALQHWNLGLRGRTVIVPTTMEVFLQGQDERAQYSESQTYNLGDVTVGRTANTFIYLGSSGTASLYPYSLDADGEGFSVESELAALPEPGGIRPGVSATYVGVLRFEPMRQGTHTGALTIRSNDINGTEFTIPLRANAVQNEVDIRIDGVLVNSGGSFTGEYDFGEVLVGDGPRTKEMTACVRDFGHYIIEISFENNESGQFDIVSSFIPSNYMCPSSSLSFMPTKTGPATAVLVVRGYFWGESDEERMAARLTLRGTGVAPQMSVEVPGQTSGSGIVSYDFGMVPDGVEQATVVTISNNGDGNLNIESIRVAGAGYRLAGKKSDSIGPGSHANWLLRFTPPGDAASYRGVLTIISNDKRPVPQGVWTMELNGGGVRDEITSATDSYDFGYVRVGATATVAFAATATVVTSGSDVYRVAPGHSTGTWKLSFAPTSTTVYTGELETDGRRLGLRGTGAEPQMAVVIEPYDWSQVRLATTEDMSMTVSVNNTGKAELDISSIGVTGNGYSLANADVPQTVVPGSTTTFSLHFTPTLPGTHTATLSIVSNNPQQHHWTTSVTGHGVGPRLVLRYKNQDISDGSVLSFRSKYYDYGDTFDLYNLGNEDLTVNSLRGEGSVFARFKEGNVPQVVSSNGVIMVRFGLWERFERLMKGDIFIGSNDPVHPVFRLRVEAIPTSAHLVEVYIGGRLVDSSMEHDFGSVPVGGEVTSVRVHNPSDQELILNSAVVSGSPRFGLSNLPTFPVTLSGTTSLMFDLSFTPTVTGTDTAGLILSTTGDSWGYYSNHYIGLSTKQHTIILRGNGVPATPAPSAWAGGAQRAAIPTFAVLEPVTGAPRFVGLGYADVQSRLWLAFDEPAQILSGTDARALADGTALSGFEVLPNYTGGGAVEDIGVLRARYRSGGVVMDLARGIVSADALIWARYTPPSDGVSGIYDLASPPNRISSVRLFMLPRSAVLDYDGDGFPDALEARLGGNPLVADDVVGLPEIALLRAGVAGSPAAVAYSGIRADGVATHLGVVTTGASSLAAYYLSDTFGYSGGYAPGVGGYGCTGRFPADYASPLFGGGCAAVDFNSIRAGVEHRIGWLATNAAGYWAVAEGTASRLPEMVILRVPEFNMKRRNVFVANSDAADATVVVGAFHDGPASSQSLTVSFSNVAAADSPSSSQPDGFSVSVAGGAENAAPGAAAGITTNTTPDITSYAITGVHSGETSKLWLAGDPLSSLTPDKYSLGKVTQTDVVRLADDSLPPLFGRASLYAGSTAGVNERHAVVVRGTENYIALLPVVQGSAQTASAFEVLPWDGAGGGPVAVDDRILAVNETSPAADGALVRIAFTASSPPATVRNTVSLEVAASSAGASTATTVLTWPVIDSADALALTAGDNDNDGIPDVRDSYRLLNRLPVSVAGGISGYPDRSSAGADGWHHIRPLLPLHNQFAGSYATRAGLSFHTGFVGDARILARLPVATSGGQTIAASGGETVTAPEGQSVLAATYQPGVPVQMNYADFAASLSRDEFDAMTRQSRRDISVVYNFRLHGVEPSVAEGALPAQGAALAGGRAGVVIPLPESLHEHTNILPLHYTNGAWSGFSTEPDTPATAGFAPLQAGVCPDDSGVAGSPYRTESGALNTRKRTGDACMVLYLTDGAAADRDGNINGVVDALIGLAATLPR